MWQWGIILKRTDGIVIITLMIINDNNNSVNSNIWKSFSHFLRLVFKCIANICESNFFFTSPAATNFNFVATLVAEKIKCWQRHTFWNFSNYMLWSSSSERACKWVSEWESVVKIITFFLMYIFTLSLESDEFFFTSATQKD